MEGASGHRCGGIPGRRGRRYRYDIVIEFLRHERGILDTNLVIVLSRLDDPTVLPEEVLITAVTLAELSVGPLVATTDVERAARQAHLQQAEADFDPLPFDAAAARAFGQVAASIRRLVVNQLRVRLMR